MDQPVAVVTESTDERDQQQHYSVAERLLEAFEQKTLCDVVFTFGKDPDRIDAHKLLLSLRSPVFLEMFKGEGSNAGEKKEVKITQFTPQPFKTFLEFLYADKFKVNDMKGALDLLALGVEYNVQPLVNKCDGVLKTIEMKAEDTANLLKFALNTEISILHERACAILSKFWAEICRTDTFLSIQEDKLVCLLRKDDLAVEELELFKLVVRWGKNKMEGDFDPDQLKICVARLLPLVRYAIMTPTQFALGVIPLNLLTPEKTTAICSYFAASNEAERSTLSEDHQLITKCRGPLKVTEYVELYNGGSHSELRQQGQFSLIETVSLFVSNALRGPMDGTDPSVSRKLAISGIHINWPSRSSSGSHVKAAQIIFHVVVMQHGGRNKRPDEVWKFERRQARAEEREIWIDPPLEIVEGAEYTISIEDRTARDSKESKKRGNREPLIYTYTVNCARACNLKADLSIYLRGSSLKLEASRRPTLGKILNNYGQLCLIDGIRLTLI